MPALDEMSGLEPTWGYEKEMSTTLPRQIKAVMEPESCTCGARGGAYAECTALAVVAPEGKRNGNYRHGARSKEMIELCSS